jgi:hypothetical protein
MYAATLGSVLLERRGTVPPAVDPQVVGPESAPTLDLPAQA